MGGIADVAEMNIVPKQGRVREIIGRSVLTTAGLFDQSTGMSIDATRGNYGFWDKFRRGAQVGYEFGALFAQPITEIIASSVAGKGIEAKLNVGKATETNSDINQYSPEQIDTTNNMLSRFLTRNQSVLLSMIIDLYALGDQYIIVNADGTLSVPSPDTVRVAYDLLDYRKPIKYIITTKLEKATITDEYREDGRTITIKEDGKTQAQSFEFQNLIGRIPVVHFANDRSANETQGRPIYEALLHLFSRYNDLLEKALDGVEIMGNPIPTVEGAEDPEEVKNTNGVPTGQMVTNANGEQVPEVRIDFSQLAMFILGKGASFKMVAPSSGFTGDVRDMLKLLFLLILDKTRIPEVVWGNEMSGAQETSGEQLKAYHDYVTGRRTALEGMGADDLLGAEAQGGLYALLDIWLKTKSLTDPSVAVAATVINWSELSQQDETQKFQWTQWAQSIGLITDEKALDLSGLVEDPAAEVEAAQAENAGKTDQYDQAVDAAIASYQQPQTQVQQDNADITADPVDAQAA